jgi:hypothetical protein
MNAQPFIAEAQAKGAVFAEAARQVGEFAQMRYKAARETQINEKVLAAEEALRTKSYEFAKTPTGKLGSVFNEGGDPNEGTWAKSTSETLSTLLSDVKDVDARRILTDRFNQMELTQRFSLRGVIDRKLEAANAAARAAMMRNAESKLSQATTIDEVTGTLNNVGVTSARLGALGLGDPNALKAQEYALLVNGAKANVMAYLGRQEVPSEAAENLRLALRNDDNTLAGNGQVQYKLLKMLPLEAQASILGSATRTAGFIDALSESEKRAIRLADGYAKDAGQSITSYTSQLQNGWALPDAALDDLRNVAQQVKPHVDPNVAVELAQGIDDLEYLNGIVKDTRAFASPSMIQDKIFELEALKSSGNVPLAERDRVDMALEFMSGWKKKMVDGLASDPIAYASRAGAYSVEPVDLSPAAMQSGDAMEGVQNRIEVARAIQSHYEVPGPLRIFSKAELSQFIPQLTQGTAATKLMAIEGFNRMFDNYAPDVLAQVAEKEPMFAHVAGLSRDGRYAESETILKGMERIEAGFKPFEGADVSVAKQNFNDVAGAALAMLPASVGANLRKNIYDGAQAYYAEKIAQRADKEFDEDLWTESVQAASGYDTVTGKGGIQTVRDVPTLLPPMYKASDLEDALSNLTPERLEAVTGLVGTIDRDLAEDIIDDEDYRLQVFGKSNGRIIYGIMYGQYGDARYGIATDNDGVPIRFSAERLTSISNLPIGATILSPAQAFTIQEPTQMNQQGQ